MFPYLLAEKGTERVFAFDEARFGLKVWHRRRWCPKGVRPPYLVEDRYEWLWLYAAVDPVTGESFFLFLPWIDGNCLEIFLREFHKQFADHKIALVLDNCPSHKSQQVHWPDSVHPVPLPPYSPELNPAEKIFWHIRERLSNRIFEDLEDLENALTECLAVFWEQPQDLITLTAFPWWIDAAQSITTFSN